MEEIKINEILTQMKAIRANCLDCMCYQPGEVAKCSHTECALYPYRFGVSPKGFKKVVQIEPFLRRIEKGGEGPRITRENGKLVSADRS